MTIVALLIALLGLLLTAAVVYLIFWAFVYLGTGKEPNTLLAPPRLRFAVVVPAHDEEEGIAHTLENLKTLDYPRELFEIVAIADNCTDGTVDIAKSCGVRTLKRNKPELRGKGYALSFAFTRLLNENFDAFVVVDADAVLDADFLRVMNERLLRGEKVVQAYCGLSNPDANPLTYTMQVGNVMENLLFYAGKARLGLPAVLRGTGMCLSREILTAYPWDSFSVVEDTEYTVRLVREGIDILFAAETRVLARQPENLSQARTQRVRWASGNLGMTRAHAVALIREGASRKNGPLLDLGWSLLIVSKPLLILSAVALAGASLLAGAFTAQHGFALMFGLMPAALLFFYFTMGIAVTGVSFRRLAYLLCTPWYLGWFVVVSLLGLAGYRSHLWLRTGRT